MGSGIFLDLCIRKIFRLLRTRDAELEIRFKKLSDIHKCSCMLNFGQQFLNFSQIFLSVGLPGILATISSLRNLNMMFSQKLNTVWCMAGTQVWLHWTNHGKAVLLHDCSQEVDHLQT